MRFEDLDVWKRFCGELRTQIYIGKEIGYLSDSVANAWIKESQEISSMLAGLIKTKRGFVNRED
jgi:four helix bundle protein